MIRAIADTHAIIWYLFGDQRMSLAARTLITTTAANGDQIGISSMSMAEIVYLIEKRRIEPTTFERIVSILDRPDAVFVEVVMDRFVAQAMRLIERTAVPDFPDRMIAATAVHLGVPVISRDGKITLSSVATIW